MVAVYFINIFLRFHNKILPKRNGKVRGSVNRLGHSAVNAGEWILNEKAPILKTSTVS